MAPGAEVQVVLGVMVTKPGRYRFDALALDYHVGGTVFRDIYPSSGQLCSPLEKYKNTCPGLLIENRGASPGRHSRTLAQRSVLAPQPMSALQTPRTDEHPKTPISCRRAPGPRG